MMNSTAILDIQAERDRQITVEGWTAEHDDVFRAGQLACAAAAYSAHAAYPVGLAGANLGNVHHVLWPWHKCWWKPTTPRRDLVKAGALIVAEIDRLDRIGLLKSQEEWQAPSLAPYGEWLSVRLANKAEIVAMLLMDHSETEDGDPCDQWVARDDDCPSNWTDNKCWQNNADEVASTPVVAWKVIPKGGA
ncbi:MAG: hypothetical protein ABID63_18385 [Pseudomonadota bacterium]